MHRCEYHPNLQICSFLTHQKDIWLNGDLVNSSLLNILQVNHSSKSTKARKQLPLSKFNVSEFLVEKDIYRDIELYAKVIAKKKEG